MSWSYSVIVSCIGEGRPPNSQELDKLAARIRKEAFQAEADDRELERRVLHVAQVALDPRRSEAGPDDGNGLRDHHASLRQGRSDDVDNRNAP